MNFKNKRLISTVIVVVLVVFSLIKGTITSSNNSKKDDAELNGYLTEFLQEQSVTKLTLKKGNSSEVIQKISIDGEINAEMTNTYSRGSVLNQIKEEKGLSNPTVIELRADKTAESLISRFVKATTKSFISELNSEVNSNKVERSYLG